jgi:alpha-tubulin suppressor-like RCC1 family protein
LSNVTAVAAGETHTLALKADGTIVGWNSYGPITIPPDLSEVAAIAAGSHSLVLKSNGTVVTWSDLITPATNMPPGLSNIVAIAAGRDHSVALTRDGAILSWGDNTYGQTNVPAGLTNVMAIAAGTDHSLALTRNGFVIGWGRNLSCESITPADLSGIAAITGGGWYSMAIKVDLRISAIRLSGPNIFLRFGTVAGQHYGVEYSLNLALPNWIRLPSIDVPGTGSEVEVSDAIAPGSPARFYRIICLP